eukprot:SAG22_NODE_3448_length_1705_cov_10.592777_1_plen_198_part_00
MPGGKGKGKDYCHDWWPEMGKKRKEPEPTDEASKDLEKMSYDLARYKWMLDDLREENDQKAKEIERILKEQQTLKDQQTLKTYNKQKEEIAKLVARQNSLAAENSRLEAEAESRKCHCGQVVRGKNCVLTTCGHTFARLNIGAWLNQRGAVQSARPGTIPFLRLEDNTVVGGLLGSYAPCPNCRVPFGESEIKTIYL